MPDLHSPCLISYMVGNFENRTMISGILANFLLCLHRNSQNSISGQIFNPKFENPRAVSYFGGTYSKIYAF